MSLKHTQPTTPRQAQLSMKQRARYTPLAGDRCTAPRVFCCRHVESDGNKPNGKVQELRKIKLRSSFEHNLTICKRSKSHKNYRQFERNTPTKEKDSIKTQLNKKSVHFLSSRNLESSYLNLSKMEVVLHKPLRYHSD